ncbi:autotransporter-associated beta strand repeat-containing protein [Sphingomonas sp. CBMAI 2297]|uniref:autotransporter-associated beta strand repeat-containing protein n=1 Tax=Sphingomonas sp. CBMAI 2297 TaxID=2991720 RepID=UPI0024541D4B|nr:autotransporter-associated beta strand repeat-containing protein [Sphingomonas sp. CBMAI 2297]
MTAPILRTPRRARNLLLASTALVAAAAAAAPAYGQTLSVGGGTIEGGAPTQVTDETPIGGGIVLNGTTTDVAITGVTVNNVSGTTIIPPRYVAAYFQDTASPEVNLRVTDSNLAATAPSSAYYAVALYLRAPTGNAAVNLTLDGDNRFSGGSGIWVNGPGGTVNIRNNGTLTFNGSGEGIFANGGTYLNAQLGRVDINSGSNGVRFASTETMIVKIDSGSIVASDSGIYVSNGFGLRSDIDVGASIMFGEAGLDNAFSRYGIYADLIENRIVTRAGATIDTVGNGGSAILTFSAVADLQIGGAIGSLSTGTDNLFDQGIYYDSPAGSLRTTASINARRGIYASLNSGTATFDIGGDITAQDEAIYAENGATALTIGSGITLRGNQSQAGKTTITLTQGSIDNYGTIVNGAAGTPGNGSAVSFLNGGSLINRSGATISSGSFGVNVAGAAGTIDNYGTITAGNAAGIMLNAGGTATNHANITATGNNSTGLRSTGAASTLDNRGTINANIGIRTDASGSTLNNSGTINATSFGIYVPSGTATLVNSGTVNGSVGATLNGGGSITNTGSLIGVSYGITSAGAATIVVNDGTISGGSGAISLSTFNDIVTLNSGSTTIGSINLGNGNDTINIMTGATFGTIAGGNGTDTVVLDGPTTGTLNLATVNSFEILNKVGTGTWTLSGAAASPAMAITAGNGTPSGTLVFSGTGLTGTIKVNGATIRATGAGAFGTGTITAIDPTIQYAATGSYANQIILAAIDPANDPTRLEADAGVVATLTGQLIEQSGGQPLVIGGAGTIILTNQNNFWSGGTQILAGATLQGSGTALGNGSYAIANDGTIIFDESSSYFQIGVVSGSGALVKRGAGTLTLASANSFTGTTTIEAGTLSLSNTGALAGSSAIALTGTNTVLDAAGLNSDGLVLNNLSGVAGSRVLLSGKSTTLANSANTIFAGTLGSTPTSTGALTKSGTGTLTLAGNNSDLLLPVLVNQGTLALSGGGTLASASYVAVNGGTFDISGVSGAGAAIKDLRGTGGSVALGDKLLTITAAANGNSFGGVISGNGGITLAAGVATLAGANTHSGTTTIASGAQLNLSGAGSLASSDVAANGFFQLLNADASVRSFSGGGGSAFLNGYTLTIANGGSYAGQFNNGTLNLTGGTLTLTGNNSLNTIALNGGNLTLGNGGTDGYLYSTSFVLNDGTLTINKADDWTVANIGGGAGNLVQAGSGILSLWNNSYTGSTTVTNGRLRLFNGNAINDGSALIIGAAGTAELFGSDETIGSLSGAGSFILNGNMLTINNGGMFSGVIGDSNGGTLVIAGGTLTLTGANANSATTIAQGAGLTLGNGGAGGSVRGTITANGTLTVDRSDSLSVTGLIGSGSLVQAGGGTTRLGGAADFTGAVTVANGTLALDTSQVLSNGSGIALSGTGAVLDLTVAGGTINTLSGASGAVVRYGDHGMRIVQGADAIFAGSFDDVASGAISPTPALTLAGTARLTLTGQSDLAAVRIDGGTLALAGSGSIGGGAALTMASGTLDLSGVAGAGHAIGGLAGIGTVTLGDKNLTIGNAGGGFSGVIQGNGGLHLTGGTLTLGGVNTYTGTTVIDAGAGLALTGSGSIASPTITVNGVFDVSGASGALPFTHFTGTGNIRLGNGVLSIAGNGGESDFTGAITQAAGYGNGAVTIASGHQTVATDWSYGGITTLLNGASMTIGDGAGNGSLSGAIALNGGTLTTNRTGTVQVNGLSGAGTLKIAGPGTTNLAGSGVFTGNVIVADGTLSLSGPNQLLAASSVALTGANAVLNVGAGIGERINNLSGVAGSRVNLGPKGLTVNNSAATLFAGTLQEATFPGSSGFLKNGAGTLTLTGQNMLQGVTVEVGTLALSGNGALGANAAVSVASGATLDLSGLTSGATEFGGLRDDGTVDLGANTLTFNNPDSTSFGGVIQGSGGLTIASGFQILSGANTYTGDTNINDGAALFLNGGSLASGTVIADGTLAIGGWGAALTRLTGGGAVRLVFADLSLGASDFSGEILGLGNLAFANGTSTLRGANTYLGTTTIDGGATLALAGAGTIGGGALIAHGAFDISGAGADIEIANLSGNGTVALGANRLTVGWDDEDSDFGGVIGGTGGLTKTGTGVLTLSGANTYSGLTLVDAGTLRLGASGVLADDSTLEVRNGATLDLNGFDETVASFTIAGNLIGGGTLTAAIYNLLGGTIDHDLGAGAVYQRSGVTLLNGTSAGSAVHVEGGTLQLGASQRLADTAIVTVLAGATLDLQGHDETIGSLALAGTLGGSGTLTAATYTLDGATVFTNLGTGTLTQHSGVSDLNGTAAAGIINVTGGTLRLGGSDRLSDTASVAVASGAVLDVQGNSDTIGSLALAGTLGGTGTLTAATTMLDGATVAANLGAGTLVQRSGTSLLGGTTAAGRLDIAGGTLRLGASDRLLDTGLVTVAAGTTLDLQGFDDRIGTLTLAGTLAGTGTLTAATTTLDGAVVNANLGTGMLIQHSGTSLLGGTAASDIVRIDSGMLRLGASDRLADSAAVTVASGATLDLQGFDDRIGTLALAGTLAGTGTLTAATTTLDGAIVSANLGTGTLVQHSGTSLLGGTAASGTVRIDGGTLRLGGADRLAAGAAVTVARDATLDLQGFGGSVGTLALAGTLAGTGTLSAASYTLDGATVHANLGTGTLVQNSGVSVLHGSFAGGSAQINGGTLAFDRAGATTYAGSFSGSGTVAQAGTGTLTLSGNSAAFAGTTTVSGGGLAVIGQLGGDVQVASTLSGTGSIGGTVSIADGAHLVGATGGTLAMGALTLASGSVIDVTLSQPPATALFAVSGDLTLDGTLNIAAQPSFGAGVYRLFSYGGALTDNGLVLGTVTGIGTAGLSVQTGNIGQVNLVSTSGATLAFWDGAAAASHDNGRIDGGSGSWSLGTRNWTDANGAVNGPMQPVPSFAVFQGNGGAVTIDNGAGQVSATGMQFATGGYTLSGGTLALSGAQATVRVGDGTAAGAGMTATIASALTGGAMLVKTDLGTLVLTGANSYTGGTAVQAGTLIGNAASIQGSVQNAGTVVFDQASNATFAGTISGAGSYVKSGAGALTLTGASSSNWRVTAGSLVSTTSLFTGNVDLSQGTSLVFNQAANGTYAGTLSGTGSVLFQGGGTVLLTGNSAGFAGATTVGAGSLFSLNGTLGGTIDVLAGGRLQGGGTAGSASIAGTIAPGNSIGTLAFTGNLAFASGSVFEVEANAAGQSDKIVVGGSASIASGATVRVLATDGNYAANTSYTILTAAGGLNGTFSNVTTNLAFLTPTLAYGVNAVTLNLKRNTVDFIAVAQTGNQAAVAPRVQALGAGNGVYEAVAALTAPEARAAFDQLAGSDYASMRASLVEDSRFMRDAMLARDEMAGADGLAAWGRVTGAWRDVDGNAQAQGYRRSAKGFVTGFDGSFGNHWRIGVALGYGTSEFRTSNATHKAASYQAGGSLLGSYGPVSIQLGTAYGWHAIASQRHVAFGSLRQLLGDNYDARTFQAFGQLGVKGSIGGVDLQPFVGLAHVALSDSGVNEHGGAAALHGSGSGFDATYASLGLKARIGWDLGGTRLSLDGSAAARRVFGDRVPGIDLAFAGGSAFQARGIPLDRTSAAVDLGLALDLSEHIRLGVSYTGTYADRSSDHGARAQLSWRF